jgi:AcrR family transcriptional regulator
MAQKYDAPRRRAQAQETRERVLRSAQRLFTSAGYARTSVARVASDAKVSDRLLYNLFGSKRGLLLALLEHFAPTPFEVFEAKIANAGNAAAQLAVAVDFVIGYYAAAKDLLAITLPAAGTDVDLHAFVEQGERFRRLSQRPLIERWEKSDALRPELTPTWAADVLWAMTSPEFYLKLDAAGWTSELIRTWLIQTLVEVLLQPGGDSERPDPPRSPISAP